MQAKSGKGTAHCSNMTSFDSQFNMLIQLKCRLSSNPSFKTFLISFGNSHKELLIRQPENRLEYTQWLKKDIEFQFELIKKRRCREEELQAKYRAECAAEHIYPRDLNFYSFEELEKMKVPGVASPRFLGENTDKPFFFFSLGSSKITP